MKKTPALFRSDSFAGCGRARDSPGRVRAVDSSVAKAFGKHADATADPHRFAVQLLADFPNDSAMLVHREADGPPEWHETQVDVFFVQAGSATLVLGGTLVNGETVGPHEKRNGTIQGGVRRRLSAGDVVRIPPGVPHQLLLEGSHEFNYFVVKIKGY
jgi:mannose-6-phosphate isomerase-like protein (cupin superfamily)